MLARRTFALVAILPLAAACAPRMVEAPVENTRTVTSPDGRIVVSFRVDEAGVPRYQVELAAEPVLQESRLGLVRDDADFSTGLRLRSVTATKRVVDRYEILTAKRRQNVYEASRRVFRLETAGGQRMDIVFQVSNDGVGFRYVFPDTSAAVRRIVEEKTSYRLLPGSRAWLQPMQVAGTGWGGSNPAYEEYYQQDIPAGTPSTLGAGWVYPALFRSGLPGEQEANAGQGEAAASARAAGTWLLVSETGLGRNYAGTRLRHESPGGEYLVGFPDSREGRMGGPVNPESSLPWATPWRVLVIGRLQTIAESMLGIDLAEPPVVKPAGPVVPGKAAWSWPLLGDQQTVFDTQRQFVDYAADMGWRYTLVDALWDRQIGYEKLQELIDYAKLKHVSIILWYNSAGPWNTTPQTPRDVMLTHETRVAEFARLKRMGVAGLKIDFFGADGQSMIAYYHDIMTDAAPYGLLLNFHGATLPRGWSRTYPHLMTMEGIKGLEFATFGQENADQVPAHATMLPFARNVFDPMDFTPVVLDRYPRTQRRTTAAAELAQAVLFTSGIQHYAEVPAGMAKAPEYARDFLRRVPGAWDDIRFLDGYPGKYVALARRSGDAWWLAGLNGETVERELTLDVREIAKGKTLSVITDGADSLGLRQDTVRVPASGELKLKLQPRGGFVARELR